MQLDLYEFRNVHGHIEVYEKQNGNFIVSDDTYKEAVSSLLEILSNNKMIAWFFRGCQEIFGTLFPVRATHAVISAYTRRKEKW